MPLILGVPLAAAMFLAWGWSSYCIAERLVGDGAPHLRWCATAILQLWLGALLFHGLATCHAFGLAAALPLCAALTIAAHLTLGRPAARRLAADLATAGTMTRRLSGSPILAGLILLCTVSVGARLWRGLVSPPLAWDTLLYHAYKPATWLQLGTVPYEPAPDQWSYLAYFPHGGQIPWAWALLPVHCDALLAPAAVWIWSLIGVAAYGLARTLSASRRGAVLGALATAFLPAAVTLSTSAYVDTVAVASFLFAFVFVARLARAADEPGGGWRRVNDAVLAMMAFALLSTVKLSGLPTLLLGALLVAGAAWRCRLAREQRRRAILLSLLVVLAVMAPIYLPVWAATGSPLYPLPLRLFGHTLQAGNQELALLYSGQLLDVRDGSGVLPELLRVLVTPAPQPGLPSEYFGFGWGVLGLLLLGLDGGRRLLGTRGLRWPVVAMLAMASLPLVAILTPAYLAHRTYWRYGVGRLLLSLPATLSVLAATVPGRLGRLTLALVVLLELSETVPRGFCDPAVAAMRALLPWLLVALALAALLFLLARRARRPGLGAAMALLVALPVLAGPLERIRREARPSIFAAMSASERPAFDMHAIFPAYSSAAPIWKFVDDGAPHRLAVTGGWDGVGHNMLRYPLLGSHLQNELSYVPITTDGAIVDYRLPGFARLGDRGAWLERLAQRQIEYVVALGPPTLEQAWMEAAPALFTRVAFDPRGLHRVYRFNRRP